MKFFRLFSNTVVVALNAAGPSDLTEGFLSVGYPNLIRVDRGRRGKPSGMIKISVQSEVILFCNDIQSFLHPRS